MLAGYRFGRTLQMLFWSGCYDERSQRLPQAPQGDHGLKPMATFPVRQNIRRDGLRVDGQLALTLDQTPETILRASAFLYARLGWATVWLGKYETPFICSSRINRLIGVPNGRQCPASGDMSGLPQVVTQQVQLAAAEPLRVKVSCGLPRRDSYQKKNGVMVFTLRPGDTGKCQTDAKATKSPTALSMERAEVMSTQFQRFGPTYRYSTLIHMSPDHASSRFTTFFQVHQWINDVCECGAPVMLSFHKDNQVWLRLLNGDHHHFKTYIPGWSRADFEDRWVEVAVDIDSRAVGFSPIRVYLGGQLVHEGKTLLQQGGQLFFKTGMYRDVERTGERTHDVLYARNPRLAILE